MDKRPKQLNMDIRFRSWNVRSLYRAGSLVTVSKELSNYTLDLVGVQEVRWEGGGTEPEYTIMN
jgi:exonuclease III